MTRGTALQWRAATVEWNVELGELTALGTLGELWTGSEKGEEVADSAPVGAAAAGPIVVAFFFRSRSARCNVDARAGALEEEPCLC